MKENQIPSKKMKENQMSCTQFFFLGEKMSCTPFLMPLFF